MWKSSVLWKKRRIAGDERRKALIGGEGK